MFDEMQASYESDKELIQNEIIIKFGGKDRFQAEIDKIAEELRNGDVQGTCSHAIWLVFMPCK